MAVYKINTNRNIGFDIESTSEDLETLLAKLNNTQLLAVSISGVGLSKRNIISIAPADETGLLESGVYQLMTSDGSTYRTNLAAEDSVNAIVQRVNDRQLEFIRIGDVIIQSRNFDFIIASEIPETAGI